MDDSNRLLDALLTRSIPQSLCSNSPRSDEGAFPTDAEIDECGYPDDKFMEEISLISFKDSWRWLYNTFPKVWASIPYAHIKVSDTEEEREIYVATRGWSGCESVIESILQHYMLRYYCECQKRGGVYIFKLPHKDPNQE